MNDVSIIIPARHDSSRFPGKPLAKINGKEMILRVADGCAPAFGKEHVYVVSDDTRIKTIVESAGYKVFMTTKCQDFPTGSDRVAYASQFVNSKYIIDIQGDEPLVNYEDIRNVYNCLKSGEDIVCCYQTCKKEDYMFTKDGINFDLINEFENQNTIKAIIDFNHDLIYMSRQPIPTNCKEYKKQVCIYGWKKNIFTGFFGEEPARGTMEIGEDILILRCLDRGYNVKMLKVKGSYQSVDEKVDIKKVEKILNGRN